MPTQANITLREATIEDLALLQHWDQQEHTIASDPNDDWDWEKELPRSPSWRKQLIAELNNRPLGFIQIIDPFLEETHYWGDVSENLRAIDIWIGEKNDLGKGYGTIMMQKAIELCFANKDVTAILIDPLVSNTKAIRFYERLGFKFLQHRTFDKDDCAVYQLLRSHWRI